MDYQVIDDNRLPDGIRQVWQTYRLVEAVETGVADEEVTDFYPMGEGEIGTAETSVKAALRVLRFPAGTIDPPPTDRDGGHELVRFGFRYREAWVDFGRPDGRLLLAELLVFAYFGALSNESGWRVAQYLAREPLAELVPVSAVAHRWHLRRVPAEGEAINPLVVLPCPSLPPPA